jgi:hypothetical protein
MVVAKFSLRTIMRSSIHPTFLLSVLQFHQSDTLVSHINRHIPRKGLVDLTIPQNAPRRKSSFCVDNFRFVSGRQWNDCPGLILDNTESGHKIWDQIHAIVGPAGDKRRFRPMLWPGVMRWFWFVSPAFI